MASCQGLGGTGVKYTYAQLQGLWINEGGPAIVAPIAGAIALAESGGCSTALNPDDNGGTQSSFGFWQISNGTHNPSVPNIYDPSVNAQQAVAKYKAAGNSFSPWGTYNSGAYKAYLNNSTTPDTSVGGGSGGTTTTAATSGANDCVWSSPSLPVVGSLGCLLSQGQARALIGGAALAAGGLAFLAGLLVLAASGLEGTGAGRAAGQAVARGARIARPAAAVA